MRSGDEWRKWFAGKTFEKFAKHESCRHGRKEDQLDGRANGQLRLIRRDTKREPQKIRLVSAVACANSFDLVDDPQVSSIAANCVIAQASRPGWCREFDHQRLGKLTPLLHSTPT